MIFDNLAVAYFLGHLVYRKGDVTVKQQYPICQYKMLHFDRFFRRPDDNGEFNETKPSVLM